MRKITYKETHWLKYQMAIKGITQDDIASQAGCSQPMVSQVLYGRKRSVKVRNALAQAFGYTSLENLLIEYEKQGT
jgi:transcriptional regulator with XRE-family HTH domain